MNLLEKRDQLKEERETYIMELWKKEMWKISYSELLKFNNWIKIYDNLMFPWEKLLKFHLTDNKIKMEIMSNLWQIRYVDSLDNNSVVNTLRFFVNNTEELMKNKYWEYQFKPENPLEDLSHESHISWEISTANKKQFLESLLESLQKRKSIKWPWESKLLLSEKLYIQLGKVFLINDKSKLIYLDNLLNYLPNFDRELRPSSEEIEWIFDPLD